MRRVVITGIGLVTALGVGAAATWEALVAGKSAIGPLTGLDPSSLRTKIGAEIAGLNAREFVTNRRLIRSMTRGDLLSMAGAVSAVRDAGLDFADRDTTRVGLFVGGNKEVANPMHMLDAVLASRGEEGTADIRKFGEVAPTNVYPLFFIEGLPAAPLFYISDAYGLKGANTYFSGTADAGSTAIGRGYRAVKRGEADIVIAGAFDDATSWWNLTKFDGLGVLTGRNDLGARAVQPFDRDRDGAAFGEGATFLILEEREAAQARGATIYAEVTGYGSAYDGYQTLTPRPDGQPLAHAISAALREGNATPEEVGYVAAHGCGTILGDRSEASGLRAAFGQASAQLAASSVKPATGHLCAAAGALNVGVAALALHHHVAPPTLHLMNPDPACDLDWIPNEARSIKTDHALALARGLEGQNVALALRAG
jgi:3-oxoacyl-[acyl-carrier-protein] synthase II